MSSSVAGDSSLMLVLRPLLAVWTFASSIDHQVGICSFLCCSWEVIDAGMSEFLRQIIKASHSFRRAL